MADSEFLKGVVELYQGEVVGELIFVELLRTAGNEDERYKLATILQLESETKIRLRPWVFHHRLDLHEDAEGRAEGLAAVESLKGTSWLEKMKVFHDLTRDRYIPRYQEIAAMASSSDREMANSMVEHETALFEMARRELSSMADRSVEPIVALLKYPLSRSRLR